VSESFANHETERYRAFVGLLGRLSQERDIPLLTAAELDAHAAGVPLLAVLYTGDPTRTPESWDVAVVLPELLRSTGGYAAATLRATSKSSSGIGFVKRHVNATGRSPR